MCPPFIKYLKWQKYSRHLVQRKYSQNLNKCSPSEYFDHSIEDVSCMQLITNFMSFIRETVLFSEPLSRFFSVCFFPGDELLAHRPKSQPGGPVYLSLSGCSPLTYPARVALPVATLPPAYLSGSLHRTSLLTGKRCFRQVRGTSRIQLTWYGHVQRKAEGRLLKIALTWMPKQQRAWERPKNYMEGIRKAMKERNLNEGQWEDRKQWSTGVGQRTKTF